jgi:LAO/AO transport system kinase
MPANLTHLQDQPLSPQWLDQLAQASALKKWPLAKLISLFENRNQDAVQLRHDIIRHIQQHPQAFPRNARIIGFTGTPGAGKSSLIAELCRKLLALDSQVTVAVVAVDPSSHVSGGSILGDRTRMHYGKKEERLFFRSQASNLELGGVSEATFQVVRILRHLFDFILIETVGIGQNEIDIQYLTDHTYLVMQPLAGDQIQFMKSGIMEIPDSFVVNKCDEEKLARSSYHMLRSSLKQARLIELHAQDDYKQASRHQIFLTSAVKGLGIDTLATAVLQTEQRRLADECDQFYLRKRIARLYGEFGLRILDHITRTAATFEQREQQALHAIHQHIC